MKYTNTISDKHKNTEYLFAVLISNNILYSIKEPLYGILSFLIKNYASLSVSWGSSPHVCKKCEYLTKKCTTKLSVK